MPNKGKMSDYLTDMMLYTQQRANKGWTIDSDFRNAGYIIKGKSIVFVAGKNGILTLDFDSVDRFAEELKEVRDIAKLRRDAGFQ